MLEKIKYAGSKISEIIQVLMGVVLSVIMIAFVGSIVIGFITLCLGAL